MKSPFPPEIERGAVISQDGKYRYQLFRNWSGGGFPEIAFIGLNPSTADAEIDDPTIRRCIRFAYRWGFGGMIMVNLYAYRATDPSDLEEADDPIGPENDRYILDAAADATRIVACWGVSGGRVGFRVRQGSHRMSISAPPTVCALLARYQIHCLARNKDGSPKHPLYIRADKQLELFRAGDFAVERSSHVDH